MDFLKQHLFLRVLVLCWFSGVYGQTLTFDPIQGKNCLESPSSWSVSGKLTATSTQLNIYNKYVYVYAQLELCRVDLSQCPPAPIPTDECYCTGKAGDVYSLYIKRRARADKSQVTIEGRLNPTDIINDPIKKQTIGTLPILLEPASPELVVGNTKHDITNSQEIVVADEDTIEIQYCVTNINPLYEVTITVGSAPASKRDDCVNKTLDFSSQTDYNVTLAYEELDGCNRSGSYAVQLKRTSTGSSSGLGAGEIVGIVLGVLAALALLPAAFILYKKHKKRGTEGDVSKADIEKTGSGNNTSEKPSNISMSSCSNGKPSTETNSNANKRLAPIDPTTKAPSKLPPIKTSQLSSEADGSPSKKRKKRRSRKPKEESEDTADRDFYQDSGDIRENPRSRFKDTVGDGEEEENGLVKKVIPRHLPSPRTDGEVGLSTSVTEPSSLHSNYATHNMRGSVGSPLKSNRPPSIEITRSGRPLPGRNVKM